MVALHVGALPSNEPYFTSRIVPSLVFGEASEDHISGSEKWTWYKSPTTPIPTTEYWILAWRRTCDNP